jgi:DNA-binding MarR family transcriptional regulator
MAIGRILSSLCFASRFNRSVKFRNRLEQTSSDLASLAYDKHVYYVCDMELSLAYLLSDSARLLRRAFDARVRELGMTSPQARLLLILNVTEGENQGFYAERLEVEPISLTRMIDRMEESGLIERRRDPADRRAWRLFLTERSRQVIDQVRTKLAGLEDEMVAGLEPAQREALAQFLEMIRSNFTNTRMPTEVVHG